MITSVQNPASSRSARILIQLNSEQQMNKEPNSIKKPTFWQIVGSTLAAAVGVQSSKNRERDFTGGNIYTYIAAGVIFTVIFVVIIILVVKTVLSNI